MAQKAVRSLLSRALYAVQENSPSVKHAALISRKDPFLNVINVIRRSRLSRSIKGPCTFGRNRTQETREIGKRDVISDLVVLGA